MGFMFCFKKSCCPNAIQLKRLSIKIKTKAITEDIRRTARELAKRNARVILASRDAVRDVISSDDVGGGHVTAVKLDTGDLRSVRKFCDEFKKNEKRWDIVLFAFFIASLRCF